MARQDSRHGCPEESRISGGPEESAKHAFCLKTSTGHVIRMPDERLPKKVFYGELQEGNRSQDGQKKRYKDTLKASLKDFDITMGSWEQTAQERSKWRGLVNKGAAL